MLLSDYRSKSAQRTNQPERKSRPCCRCFLINRWRLVCAVQPLLLRVLPLLMASSSCGWVDQYSNRLLMYVAIFEYQRMSWCVSSCLTRATPCKNDRGSPQATPPSTLDAATSTTTSSSSSSSSSTSSSTGGTSSMDTSPTTFAGTSTELTSRHRCHHCRIPWSLSLSLSIFQVHSLKAMSISAQQTRKASVP